VAVIALLGTARSLNALMLGDETTRHVGLSPETAKGVVLLLGAFLAATSVSLSGLISFVGLIVPHTARALVGAEHRRLLPAAMLLGAAFLSVADGLGRLFFYPQELPVGILTAVVGAPFFLALLRRHRRAIWIS
jgi:iron complex transport system permease protein